MQFSTFSFTAFLVIAAFICLVQGAPIPSQPFQVTSRTTPTFSSSLNTFWPRFFESFAKYSSWQRRHIISQSFYSTPSAVAAAVKGSYVSNSTNNSSSTSSSLKLSPVSSNSSSSNTKNITIPSIINGVATSHVPGIVTVIKSTSTSTNSTAKSRVSNTTSSSTRKSCFPALDFDMPTDVPKSLKNWWCDMEDEYAFLGFSYEISACQSQKQLTREFKDARKTFNSRYIRIYGACDEVGYYDKVIEAAWSAGLGVQALIWFGYDGDNKWKTRKKDLFNSLLTNPKAKFVTRAVQFGSEPLYDWAIEPWKLASHVNQARTALADLKIPITVSDLTWGFQSRMSDGSQKVIDAVDFVDLHMLPYFAQNASTGDKAWYNNMADMSLMLKYTNSKKKIIWSENGWPSKHDCPGVCPNSKLAVSNVKNEKAYYDLLDSKCSELKKFPKGGVGWFAHIYNDDQEPGYGIYDYNGQMKFNFQPKTSC